MGKAVIALAVSLLGGQAPKPATPGKKYINKEDEVAFTSQPIGLKLKKMMRIDEYLAPGESKAVWPQFTMADTPDDQRDEAPTHIALPLVYPPNPKDRNAYKPDKNALKVRVTGDQGSERKWIQVERTGCTARGGRHPLYAAVRMRLSQLSSHRFGPGQAVPVYEDFVKPDQLGQSNDGIFGPFWVPVRYASAPRTLYAYWLVLRRNTQRSRIYDFRRAAYREGVLPDRKGEKVKIIDENSNGWFNDYGNDLIVVGGKGATFLSKMVMLGGKLYHLKVAPSGAKVWLKNYAGETGGIDVVSNFKTPTGCRLASVIIQAEGGAHSFDVVPASRPGTKPKNTAMHVPVGKYTVIDGAITKGKTRYRLLQGFMEPFEVQKGKTEVLEWGMPFSLEFKAEGLKFGISIRDCGVYGSGGELYATTGEPPPQVAVRFSKETGPRMRDVPLMEYAPDGKLKEYTYDPNRKGYYFITLSQKLRLLGGKSLKKTTRVAYKPVG